MERLAAALARHKRERPGAVALAEGGRAISYGELPAAIAARRRRLNEYGVRVLAIELDNGIDWVLWDLAAATAGAVCVPVPPFFNASQRAHVHAASGADARVTHRGLEPVPNATVVRLPPGTGKVTFTSGTTGTPKGVCLAWEGLEVVAGSVVEAVGASPGVRHLAALPLAVLLENVAGVYAALLAGCRVELPARAEAWTDPGTLLHELAARRANTVILVPELLRGLLAGLEATGRTLPELGFAAVGGARVAPALVAKARALGLPVYEGYGLSECGSVVALNVPGRDRSGTSGNVLPHVAVLIDDGEIVVSNPLFLGYLDGVRRGSLRTGDLGCLDGDGFLSVTGRRRNVLITSYGRNISPEWVEAELLAQPEIRHAVVCGDGCPAPGALIEGTTGAGDDQLARAIAAANRNLPEYARVADWVRVPPLGQSNGLLTGTGRPRRQLIIQRYGRQLESSMNQSDFYDRLVASTTDARSQLYTVPQLVDALQGRISRATYLAYLTQAYHHVSHTVPFLMAMGSRLPADKRWLQEAVIEYIKEETGHEDWILNDIAAAGGDAQSVRDSAPGLETEVLVAYNYDYIQRRNPVGFLGMVYMLESTSVQVASSGASSIQSALGLPDEAFSYLYSHGELDRAHMEFFRGLVNRISDAGDRAAVVEVACKTFRLFANVLRSIPHDQAARSVA